MTSQAKSGSERSHPPGPAVAADDRIRARLVFNVGSAIGAQLDTRRCQGYIGHLPLPVATTGVTLTPDIVVVCSAAELEASGTAALLDPVLVVQIVAAPKPAGGGIDPTVLYEQIPSLHEYLLVAAERRWVEQRVRSRHGGWQHTVREDPGAHVPLDSIGCILPLREIYKGVFG
jgi:Uma2 family endonuclease